MNNRPKGNKSLAVIVVITAIVAMVAMVTITAGCASKSAAESHGDAPAAAPRESSPLPPEIPDAEVFEKSAAPGAKRTMELAASEPSSRPVPSESGLKAGYADDNAQFGYFLGFLSKYGEVFHYELDVSERILVTVTDARGVPVPNARLTISEAESGSEVQVLTGTTHADGSYYFFPSDYEPLGEQYLCRAEAGGMSAQVLIERRGPRSVTLELKGPRPENQTVPVDILFVMDTTGSMGEEIQRLKNTIEIIHLNLTSMPGSVSPRFGMVLYKDYGDEYVTKTIPLTGDIGSFQGELSQVFADGGGDIPEELQAALEVSIRDIQWNRNGIRLVYIITDAPPQFAPPENPVSGWKAPASYAVSARLARQQGIKIHGVGTGGLDIQGEYILRQIAQYTGGRYLFLTYGETGESEGGVAGSVSHHTGANFQTDKLESIIIRFTREEISAFLNEPLPDPEPYIQAVAVAEEEKKETLQKLFTEGLGQLFDFATMSLEDRINTVVLPIQPSSRDNAAAAEYFSHELLMAAGAHPRFTLAEREDLQAVYDELKLQLSGLTDTGSVSDLGGLINADYLLVSDLLKKDAEYQVYLKLVRVHTGEVLSITKAVIDEALGL
ncbi:MAG: VWA domain-containing protein [Spirochaetales bacterium]|nr:VWA domain-containing protein [Spirochaetales bacterium]